MAKQPNYSQYVDHPRYGKSPRYTGLEPDRNHPNVHLHWNTGIMSDAIIDHLRRTWGQWPPSWFPVERPVPVPDIAIEADISRQLSRPVPVTHYYDLDILCVGCKRRFIFFADEQKFWYEELQFPLEAMAVHCWECRKHERWLANQKKQYEALSHVASRNADQSLEMADCCLTLMEQAIFGPQQTHHVRQILNAIPDGDRNSDRYSDLRSRLEAYESLVGTKSAPTRRA